MSFNKSKLRYCVACLIASSMLCALSDVVGRETLSLSVSGTPFELVWVPVDAPKGVKRVEIGDFSGKHPKEKKRSESIYAPFESNGKRCYYLGKTEVTEEQWASVVGQGPRTKLPVAGKTYTEIQLFIDKLNGMVRESGDIPRTPDGAEGFLKLPTEAEWEYAARGAEGASYADQDPYGGDLERHEVFSLPGSDGKAKEAASRPANALGLHDMLGNVRELMEGNYSVGGVAGGGLLLKGGSYLSVKGEIRSSSRTEQQRLGKDGQPSRRPDAGIRLCLSAEIFTSLGSKVPELDPISAAQLDPKDQPVKGSLKVFLKASEREFTVSKAFYSTLISALNCIAEDSPYRKRGSPFVAQRENAINLLQRAASYGIDEGASARIIDAESTLRNARKEKTAQVVDLGRKRVALDGEIKRLEWNHKMMFSASPLSGRRSGTAREIEETEEKIESLKSECIRVENLEQEVTDGYVRDGIKLAEKLRDVSFALASDGYYIQSLVASGLCRLEFAEVFDAEFQWRAGDPSLAVDEIQNSAANARELGNSKLEQAAENQTGDLADSKLEFKNLNAVAGSLADLHAKTIHRIWSIKKIRSRFDHFLSAAEFADAVDTLEKLELAAEHMPDFQNLPLPQRKKLVSVLESLKNDG
jgi:hypothetical protein